MLNYNFTVRMLSVSVGNYYVDIAGQKLILAKNVVALFKKEKYIKGLQNLCAENLMEFLGQAWSGQKPFNFPTDHARNLQGLLLGRLEGVKETDTD
ncbi:hypothetical protein C5167_050571 [Papaver somniferum]|uniref:Uncharacterized protein n=1 Tax=Papaver somniferum TaxID=3469 RepID=A0A4Y7KQI3_PAPSO|nr:hypothetical protein C5167_050571 [Papaver somniferum]